jgi:hypothetical protein
MNEESSSSSINILAMHPTMVEGETKQRKRIYSPELKKEKRQQERLLLFIHYSRDTKHDGPILGIEVLEKLCF